MIDTPKAAKDSKIPKQAKRRRRVCKGWHPWWWEYFVL